jgi:hypothetical protein
MTAVILKPGGPSDNNDTTGSENGHYEYQQDPDSGAIIEIWVPDTDPVIDIVPDYGDPGFITGRRFNCIARGFSDGGIRVAGSTEHFSSRGYIDTIDYVNLKFPADVILTRRDRVTDIRNRDNVLLWKEEEFSDKATVFEVNGVTPVMDPWGKHVENSALLMRAEVQDAT